MVGATASASCYDGGRTFAETTGSVLNTTYAWAAVEELKLNDHNSRDT